MGPAKAARAGGAGSSPEGREGGSSPEGREGQDAPSLESRTRPRRALGRDAPSAVTRTRPRHPVACSCHRRAGTANDECDAGRMQPRSEVHTQIWAESTTLDPYYRQRLVTPGHGPGSLHHWPPGQAGDGNRGRRRPPFRDSRCCRTIARLDDAWTPTRRRPGGRFQQGPSRSAAVSGRPLGPSVASLLEG